MITTNWGKGHVTVPVDKIPSGNGHSHCQLKEAIDWILLYQAIGYLKTLAVLISAQVNAMFFCVAFWKHLSPLHLPLFTFSISVYTRLSLLWIRFLSWGGCVVAGRASFLAYCYLSVRAVVVVSPPWTALVPVKNSLSQGREVEGCRDYPVLLKIVSQVTNSSLSWKKIIWMKHLLPPCPEEP